MIDEEILMKNKDGCMLSLLKHSFDEKNERLEKRIDSIEEYLNKLYLKDMGIRNPVKKGILFGIELCEEEIKNKDGIITSQSDALNKEYFINESLNSQLENLCKWETDIEDTLSDYEKGKYDDNEHQCVIDMFIIMNGILNDIRSVKYE